MSGGWTMLVYREGRAAVTGEALLRGLAQAILAAQAAGSAAERDRLFLSALLRAGELECGLADVQSPHAPLLASITTEIASARYGGAAAAERWLGQLDGIAVPPRLALSAPEGFAYYALHPDDYGELACGLTLASSACVVGIRSIGTTLSAAVQAALLRRGVAAERFTVRPQGHPFDRHCELGADELALVRRLAAQAAHFLVVDEGPGLSGSSFLATGEALLAAGVSAEQIKFLCSRAVDPSQLRAADAASRWQRFETRVVRQGWKPPEAAEELSGGAWRGRVFGEEQRWPAAWTQNERLKFLSSDERRLFKFEGLGHYGEAVLQRAQAIAAAGFGPQVRPDERGFAEYEWLLAEPGARPAGADDLALALPRLADYCAFRAATFSLPEVDVSALGEMVRHNYQQEFGVALPHFELSLQRPVLADSRLQPHEWILTRRGLMKTDAASHGDDHFFPGPCDIAWDLAGAIVEWRMSGAAAREFLSRYRQQSGDDAEARLPSWLVAYSCFRMAACKMAALGYSGQPEEQRLLRQYRNYRDVLADIAPRSAAEAATLRG